MTGWGWVRLLAAAVPLLVLAACGGGAAKTTTSGPLPPPSFPVVSRAPDIVRPWVAARGGRFVDAAGRTVLLRGVDVTLAPPVDYQQAVKAVALHANFVRIVAPWSLFEPEAPAGSTHHWDQTTLRNLDTEVAYFERHHVNVLIDFHQFHWSPYFAQATCKPGKTVCRASGVPAWYYADGRFPASSKGEHAAQQAYWTTEATRSQAYYAAFAAMIATRYAHYPNVVGYEIFNEPHSGTLGTTTAATNTMLRWQVRIRDVLRTVDPTRTVFVMCHGGGQGVGTADLGVFGSLDHLALDWHDYYNGRSGGGLDAAGDNWVPSWAATHNQQTAAYTGTLANQQAVMAKIVGRARFWHVPLVVGEWGVHTGSAGSAAYQSQMLSLFDRYGLSFARWELAPGGDFGLLTAAGAATPEAAQLARALAANPSPG